MLKHLSFVLFLYFLLYLWKWKRKGELLHMGFYLCYSRVSNIDEPLVYNTVFFQRKNSGLGCLFWDWARWLYITYGHTDKHRQFYARCGNIYWDRLSSYRHITNIQTYKKNVMLAFCTWYIPMFTLSHILYLV